MEGLSDRQVDAIAGRLAARLRGEVSGNVAETGGDIAPQFGEGIFPDVDSAVAAATTAYRHLADASLGLREKMIVAIRAAMESSSEDLARLAHEETGLGRLEDKVQKNLLVTRKTPGTEVLVAGAKTGDRGLTLFEYAPYGVIGSITPTTNPTSTIICNSIGMLAAGNSVVFNVHPGAKNCSMETVRRINRAIRSAGGPESLVTTVSAPTIESAQELMRHAGVRLLVVTGGAGVVKEAMQSGKRAICAGPGNPPVVVDASADLEQAGRDIVLGASFDNNIICVDEKEVFVVREAAEELLASMKAQGAYLLDSAELRRLERVIFEKSRGPGKPAVVKKEWIGQNAGGILSEIGIRAGSDIRLAVADVPLDHPLVWTEQMMPVLPLVRTESVDRAIDLACEAEHGFGHSASMHSRDIDALSRMARVINASIFVKNAPLYAGLGQGGEGYSSFTIASPTGEGLTGPISFSRLRRCVMVDHFRIV
ncbi:MAG: aldehyde dehydrogenase EutE [Candidatus Krumholzibacteria bacterium]|jgi:acyl-CoA reductase-like NAD-dependent aldehyde dehydrogenase|nr:aldehyde dehydrogenase EutE [Candidatus Krumholzibacteria bacterium]MDP6668518.1 aldehyde dehydrogenase EutE [Candidatus Krumholzibacteria bacterium]MDP6797808.1 aldehyde dehydrogenase EutE [Candidatus Krumholzibacteria bacterium]MDP7021399.1 aldehyde dehydrogenase EutE [Candidatus Krumholzibacteria bacterium]